jgi:hypothetical protein
MFDRLLQHSHVPNCAPRSWHTTPDCGRRYDIDNLAIKTAVP